MNTKTILIFSAVLLCSALGLSAQSMNVLSGGLFGGAAYNMHNGTVGVNEGVLECGSFVDATALRWFVGNQANIPLNESWAFSPRLYYHKASGSFTNSNQLQPKIALSDGSIVSLATTHTLDVSLDYLSLDLLGSYFLTDRVYVNGGLCVGLPTRNAFEQFESIVSPVGATFSDGSTTRRIASGYFSDKQGNVASNSLRIAAVLGAGTMIPLSSSWILNPELSFQYGLTNVISDASWKVHTLRAGAGLLYIFSTSPKVETPPPPPPPPVPVVPVAPPVASLDVQSISSSGASLNYAEVTIHDHRTLDILPLLPYIFFDAKSSQLSERYHRLSADSRGNFSENALANDQLGVYHDVLNIIGARMLRYPDATLTLQGCLDPTDDGASLSLASQRAEGVRSYLRTVWGISDSRVVLQTRGLPAMVSTRSIADGRAENRRVEISASDERILAPVFVRNAARSYEPAQLRFNPTVQYQGAINTAKYSIVDVNGRTLFTRSGPVNQVDVPTNQLGLADYKGTQPLTAIFECTSDSGKTIRAERSIPVRRTFSSSRANAESVNDTIIERYSMILFNFDRASTIAGSDEQVMRLVRSRVRTSSTVSITGMTDVIGAAKNNQILSEARANAVRNDIVSRIKPDQLKTSGKGEVDLFDNAIPEGRFYNRRVFVEIETPIVPDLEDEGVSQ